MDSQGGSSVKVFDRCLSSLVAFKDPDEARKFQQQYGGRIMNQTQVLASDIVTNRSQGQEAGLK